MVATYNFGSVYKPYSLITYPTSTMYFHNILCDLSNKILLKPLHNEHALFEIYLNFSQ